MYNKYKPKNEAGGETMVNILVVDDAGIIRYKIKNELTAEGFKVFEAPNTQVVRNDTFSKDTSLENIDLILLDIYLKGESGLDLLQYIKSKYPYIKIIMISMESKKNVVRQAVELGAEDYIVKPFDKNDMLRRINRVLSKSDIKEQQSANKIADKIDQEGMSELKTSLSLEINRAVRGDLPFSLVKIKISEEMDDRQIGNLKDNITGKIRSIDQVYILEENTYAFLLPLTDAEGSEVFVGKIESSINEEANLDDNKIESNIISFPEHVVSEEIDSKQQNEYRMVMLDNFDL